VTPVEAPFVTVPPEGETTSQLPPLVVEVLAVQSSVEPGAPVFVTVIVWFGVVDGSRETEAGLTCMSAVGAQRMVNVAEVVDGVSESEGAGPIVNAWATVLKILLKESPMDTKKLVSFFSAIGVCCMERRV
jgi:hypothetical protein